MNAENVSVKNMSKTLVSLMPFHFLPQVKLFTKLTPKSFSQSKKFHLVLFPWLALNSHGIPDFKPTQGIRLNSTHIKACVNLGEIVFKDSSLEIIRKLD